MHPTGQPTGPTGPCHVDEADKADGTGEPLFRIVRGTATESELAALAVVLLALNTPEPLPAPVTPLAAWRRAPYAQPFSWRQAA
ncbi:acyl-CoA carboxylase epsilon subunit [Streptomyces sp. NPDC093261]|uniref:acyl-CoA carboxylase epsilon subunit n=1 Tax=Streptomyces sp. NPDC093261 TaxID=3366037 RepID=UPI00380DF5CF